MDRFYGNKIYFDSLATLLQADRKLDSLFQNGPERGIPDIEISYPKVYMLLKKLGITDASSHLQICKRCPPWYYLKTNWPSEFPIYFIYNFNDSPLDSLENIKGFYKKDEYNNETWGLGDKWKMFRLVKRSMLNNRHQMIRHENVQECIAPSC
ncbi:MAG TPA: hypothetical protein PLP23_14390 [Panacibacter sp.]|nr:hypothetical protein [Panacibacter sp.]